ncbi:MAG: helical backbone metal receptor [Candidatus Hydrogenedentota bacterium]
MGRNALLPGALLALGIGVVFFSAGCGGTVEAPARKEASAREEVQPSSVKPSQKERIITFAPHITETVFALGKGEEVVAVSDFCDFPPAVEHLERVGGWHNPDLEKVTLLDPDLIIVQGVHEKVNELAQKRGFELLHVNMDSLEGIRKGIQTIGNRLQCPKVADELVRNFDANLEAISEAVAQEPRKKVLIITGRQLHNMANFHTVGGTSFVSELVSVAGGDNIYEEAGQPYIEASKETVVMRAPEAILEFHAGEAMSAELRAQYVADWQQVSSLPAVQNGCIYIITESHALRPGPRVPEESNL